MLLNLKKISVITKNKDKSSNNYLLNNIDLKIHNIDKINILGCENSGKIYLYNTLNGIIYNNKHNLISGDFYFDGVDVTDLSRSKTFNFLSVNTSTISNTNLLFSNNHLSIKNIFKDLLNLPFHKIKDEVLFYFYLVGIHNPEILLDQYQFQISKSNLFKINIAYALISKPKILIYINYPYYENLAQHYQTCKLLDKVQSTLNIALIVFSENVMSLIHENSYTYVMDQNKIIEHGSTRAILKKPLRKTTKKIVSSIA